MMKRCGIDMMTEKWKENKCLIKSSLNILIL